MARHTDETKAVHNVLLYLGNFLDDKAAWRCRTRRPRGDARQLRNDDRLLEKIQRISVTVLAAGLRCARRAHLGLGACEGPF